MIANHAKNAFPKRILGTTKLGNISKRESVNLLSKLIDIGVDSIDTAPTYPGSEQYIGNFVRNEPNNKLKIYTKFGRSEQTLTLNSFKLSFYSSLKRLGVESLYSISVHNRKECDISEEIFEFIKKLKSLGDLQRFGWSGGWDNVPKNTRNPYDFFMLPINPFIDDQFKKNIDTDKPVIAMNPFANFFWNYQEWSTFKTFYKTKIRKRFNPEPVAYLDKFDISSPPSLNFLIDYAINFKNVEGICFGSTNLNHVTEICKILDSTKP
jgi:predicted aldo/keto reductase-like oxidoreductase